MYCFKMGLWFCFPFVRLDIVYCGNFNIANNLSYDDFKEISCSSISHTIYDF